MLHAKYFVALVAVIVTTALLGWSILLALL